MSLYERFLAALPEMPGDRPDTDGATHLVNIVVDELMATADRLDAETERSTNYSERRRLSHGAQALDDFARSLSSDPTPEDDEPMTIHVGSVSPVTLKLISDITNGGLASEANVRLDDDSVDYHAVIRAAIELELIVARAATKGPWVTKTLYGVTGVWRHVRPQMDGMIFGTHHRSQRAWAGSTADLTYIAAQSPDRTIQRCLVALQRLEKHAPAPGTDLANGRKGLGCLRCFEIHPCTELRYLAEEYGVELPEVPSAENLTLEDRSERPDPTGA